MKNKLQFLLFIILTSFIFGQKTNTIDCKITYLPSIKHDDFLINISKNQSKKIDSLIALKMFKITFTEADISKIKELYGKKSINGTKIYAVSDSAYFKILTEKQIIFNFQEIEALPVKSIVDIISNVVDGSPFRVIAKTRNNTFKFDNNLAGGLKFKELRNYLIFYSIYQNIKFCSSFNKDVEEYFSLEYLLKTLFRCIERIEANT